MKLKICSNDWCIWSSNKSFCELLKKNGIPLDDKWPSLILQLRSVSDDPSLSSEQKSEMQNILIILIRQKSFTDEKYTSVRQKVLSIYAHHYEEKLLEISNELEVMVGEANEILGRHHKEVMGVADNVEKKFGVGVKSDLILADLRTSMRDIVTSFESDRKQFTSIMHEDSLTGVANRRSFDSYLTETINLFNSENMQATLILLDIDHFKSFNDEYGHRVGDQVLVALASLMRKVVKTAIPNSNDCLVARYGGDEFAIILRGKISHVSLKVAQHIRQKISEASLLIRNANGEVVHRDLKATVSIGMASFYSEQVGDPKILLLDNADKALYYAKNQGRNCGAMFVPGAPKSFKEFK